jgi:methionyl-tRNA formyltransferase
LVTEKQALTEVFAGISVGTLVVSAYNGFLFPVSVLANPNLSIVNFHNSLLPRHRGRNAPTWAIFEQDRVTGVTWHRVTRDIDAGEILAQREIPLGERTTAWELTLDTLNAGAEAFASLLPGLLNGTAQPMACVEAVPGLLHRLKDVPNGGVVDLGWSASKLSAFLRSLDYGKINIFPNPRVSLLGRQREVVGYSLASPSESPEEGMGFDGRCLRVCSGGVGVSIHVT